MPRAPRLCLDCRKVATRGSHCDEHRPAPFTKGANAKGRWQAARPGNWESLRRDVLRRDKGRCVKCGRPGNIVDHINPVAEKGRWSKNNLQTLCPDDSRKKTQEEARRGLQRSRESR
ncbi:HNH endonuclease [Actinomadura sp. KC216]|nr:HNH endonuclease [Actinomadura sp. KC216]